LKKTAIILGILVCAIALRSQQLAMIVVDLANWNVGQPPQGWQVTVNHGKPEIGQCHEGDAVCLHLKSVKASFALERNVDIDPSRTPILSWRWKVTQLPSGGDFRSSATDDQAAQVLVGFSGRRVLTYIWDTTAPRGAMQTVRSWPLMHVFAIECESGAASANQWVGETRNVAVDFMRAYGYAAPHIEGVRLQINSQHTGTTAESFFGDVAFRSAL
jgi:hypothetical protein